MNSVRYYCGSKFGIPSKRDITFLIEVDDTGGHFLSSDKMDSYGVLCVLHRKFPG